MVLADKIFILFRRYFKGLRYLSWADGFDATMRHDIVADVDLSPHRVNHLNLIRDFSGVISSAKDIEREYGEWSPYPMSDHIIISYYFRNILFPYVIRSQDLCIMEIGGGSGNLASVLYKEYQPKLLLMIDLPESIVNSFVFFGKYFSKSPLYFT